VRRRPQRRQRHAPRRLGWELDARRDRPRGRVRRRGGGGEERARGEPAARRRLPRLRDQLAVENEPQFRLVARSEQARLLTLPWALPLEEWPEELLVDVERGIGRHVVRFVRSGEHILSLKELPPRLAWREYRLLAALEREAVPSVEVVGVVADRPELPAVLVTRYLEYSLPYRVILALRTAPALSPTSMHAALAELLVRLHLAGVFWGDCSLSNALFRRDAGALSAYLVDIETGERHDLLSDGQRAHDMAIAEENIVGELHDLEAEFERPVVDDPFAFAEDVLSCYADLWDELTRVEEFPTHEGHRLEERLRRLNDLGFDVDEVEVVAGGGTARLLLHPKVVEPDHHRRRLLRLTGLDAQENQARRLLNDVTRYKTYLQRTGEEPVSDAAAAGRWLAEVFEPAVAAVPPELHGRRAPAEVFHELLEHRWFLSEKAGKDVGIDAAIADYLDTVLRPAPDERF
jgi:tRNA A-37 threonylcarbamoyl transferase component Bud32